PPVVRSAQEFGETVVSASALVDWKSTSGQTALETLDKVVYFLVGRMSYMTNPERRIFYFSQSAGNLDPEVVFQPAAQRRAVEPFGMDYTRNSIARLQRIRFHTTAANEIPDTLGDLRAPGKNFIHTL